MIGRDELIQMTAAALRDAGLTGRGRTLRAVGADVQWVVHLDTIPRTERLGVDIGLDLQVETSPRLPTDCPVLIGLENLPGIDGSEVLRVFDAGQPIDDALRRDAVLDAVASCARFVLGRLDLAAVKAGHRSGDFRSAFIRKDARAILEAEVES